MWRDRHGQRADASPRAYLELTFLPGGHGRQHVLIDAEEVGRVVSRFALRQPRMVRTERRPDRLRSLLAEKVQQVATRLVRRHRVSEGARPRDVARALVGVGPLSQEAQIVLPCTLPEGR